MCSQCAGTAAAMVGGAAGIRAYVNARYGARIGCRANRILTASLLALAVVVAGVGIG